MGTCGSTIFGCASKPDQAIFKHDEPSSTSELNLIENLYDFTAKTSTKSLTSLCRKYTPRCVYKTMAKKRVI